MKHKGGEEDGEGGGGWGRRRRMGRRVREEAEEMVEKVRALATLRQDSVWFSTPT